MESNILSILPTIHATIITIVVTVLVAIFMYAYQVMHPIKDKLISLRYQVVTIIGMPIYKSGKFNAYDYIKDRKLDYSKIKNAFSGINIFSNIDIEKNYGIKSKLEFNVPLDIIINNSDLILNLITLISFHYPYNCDIDLEYTREWQEFLFKFNDYLLWYWQANKHGINELLRQREQYEIKEQKEIHEKALREYIISIEKDGGKVSDKEIENIRKEHHHVISFNFAKPVNEFYNKIIFIQENILPQIAENYSKLTLYQNIFKVKSYLSTSLIISIALLFLGVALPLFISIFYKPPFMKTIELLLLLTLVPYFIGLFILLAKVLEIRSI